MKTLIRSWIAYGTLLVLACATFVWAQNQFANLEGSKPYTPSRLKWLAVDLNATSRVRLSNESGFSMDFVPIENEDTILIYVKYQPSVNREAMNIYINSARKVISMSSKSYGWSSWLKVKEQVQMLKAE